MKHYFTAIFVLYMVIFNLNSNCIIAQNITKPYKDNIIKKASQELRSRYVFKEKADLVTSKIDELLKQNHFDQFKTLESFSEAITRVIYDVTKDKHISVSLKPKKHKDKENVDAMQEWINNRLEERTFFRRYNANFKAIIKKENNIGYLDLRGFYGLDFGREFANAAMVFLATSDAIIIDLRNNSGGRGRMAFHLLSFFFDKQIITGKSLRRRGNQFIEKTHYTPKREPHLTMPDIPLFILTSPKTFSAAEAFSYPLKAYGRATFIGETTKGGANAGDLISLDDKLQIFIPDVAGLPHPETNEIFEGKGIEPDVKISSDKALEKALELAKIDASDYKNKKDSEAKKLLIELNEVVGNYKGENEDKIVNFYLKCRQNNLVFEEWELNSLGHQLKENSLKTAIAIFKTATVIYPHSAVAFDNYASALLKDNQKEKAIKNYKKAVEIATKNNDDLLAEFKQNLKAAQI